MERGGRGKEEEDEVEESGRGAIGEVRTTDYPRERESLEGSHRGQARPAAYREQVLCTSPYFMKPFMRLFFQLNQTLGSISITNTYKLSSPSLHTARATYRR